MARDEDFRSRRRREEKEAEQAESERKEEQVRIENVAGFLPKKPKMDAKVEDLISRAEPMIDQLNSLYQQYATGVESRPPIERRAHLDQLVGTLTMMNKPTATLRFRFTTLFSSYQTHKEKWDRMLKDIESGKIKRVTGPKKKAGAV